ncbi:MAG: T9SS type A sorting domain-containing protein, partial [Chitinophagales bacterium]|nr:T9SS type A sorting domain-containing protein [Chitinophagales bacterium]
INVSTGAFIWRLGGDSNQFTFPNDAAKFSYQHDCRVLTNGNITLFDDGNFHSPAKSFAKEYQLDLTNKIATLVWSYSHPDVNGVVAYYFAMGSAQRLSNGNTFINWGWRSNGTLPSMTEVTSAGTIVWELTLTDGGKNIVAYRGHRYLWDNICARPTFANMKTKSITSTTANLTWAAVANARQKYEVQYKKDADAVWTSTKVSPTATSLVITGLTLSTLYDWRIQALCDTLAGKVSKFTAIKTFTTKAFKDLQVNENVAGIFLYPNPAHDAITIESNGNISQVRVLNLLAQEIKQINFGNEVAETQIRLSISNLSAGNYFVEVTSNEKKEVMKLVVE